MISELITYLTTKTAPSARAFGHLYESIALIEREKRCRSFWLPHRTQCKNFIANNLRTASNKEAVLVLGSGHLHEIPLDILAQHFSRVDLVDIVHLKETKKKYEHLKNVRFIEADVTELEEQLMKEKKAINKIPERFLNDHYSLVISANLLSQLSYHLRDFLEKKARPKLSDEELDRFAYAVTKNHYEYLLKFSCPVLLITDIKTVLYDKQDKAVQEESPYIDFFFPKPKEEWWWNVAPIPEYDKLIAVKMKVAGFILNV